MSGDVTNRAEISGAPGDSPADNSASVTSSLQRPDLSIAKTDGATVVQPGDLLTYTLTISNSGPIEARGVVLRERLPEGSSMRSAGWARESDGSYRLAVGALAAGATLTRTVVIQLPNPLAGAAVTNTAWVEDDIPGDPTPADTQTSDSDGLLSVQIGDQIWRDSDGDGAQDAGEGGLAGVRLQLLDPATLGMVASAASDSDGRYRFEGLRPGRYVVQVDPQTTLVGPHAGYRLTTDAFYERTITAAQREDLTADFGLRPAATTAVTLASFSASRSPAGLQVRWRTTRELGTDRFILLRGAGPLQADAREIARVVSQGTTGGEYILIDPNAPEEGAFYWLIEVERDGNQNLLVAWSLRSLADPGAYSVFLPTLIITPEYPIGATR